MRINKVLVTLPFVTLLVIGCGNTQVTPLTIKERLHNAYLDVIEEDETDLRNLVSLTKEDQNVTWNSEGNRVLLFTFHRYPASYPDGASVTFSWGESWVCSVKEYAKWYKDNKSNIKKCFHFVLFFLEIKNKCGTFFYMVALNFFLWDKRGIGLWIKPFYI